MKEYNPPPGDTLNEILEDRGIRPIYFSTQCGLPYITILSILLGEEPITLGVAGIFERVLGVPASFWVALQKGYDRDSRIIRPRS